MATEKSLQSLDWYHTNKNRPDVRERLRANAKASYEKNKAKRQLKALEWHHLNKDHAQPRMREYMKANPEVRKRNKDKALAKAYGISLEDLVSARSIEYCEICNTKFDDDRKQHVDHCHVTNSYRGILCNNCNYMLGHAHDNPETLRAAAQYLERHIFERKSANEHV